MLRLANVATPFVAATVVVPDSVPPPGFAPSVTTTFAVKPGSVLPSASSAVTWTAGVIAAPAVTALGWTVNTSCVAVPAATLKAVLSFVAIPFVATPPAAATVVVPDSAPPPGFVPSATVTFAANWVAVFPCASCAVPCTAGVIGAPAVVLDGWTLNTSCDATPGVILNGVLVPVGRPVAAAVRVYPLPVLFTLKPGKEATPPTAATVAVPASVPPPGLAPSATVTLPVNAVAVLPCGSCAVT